MSRSIYWKITIPFIVLVLAGMSILGFYLVNSIRNTQIDHLETQLTDEAKLMAKISLPVFTTPGQPNELDSIAKTTGQEIQTRITFIAKDGTVLGDSDQDPSTMENHSTRPEVVAALSTGRGQATRYSATLHKNMLYVAVTVVNQGQVLGISRVALPLTTVLSSLNAIVITIVSVIAIVAILVILAAALIARRITLPIRRITRAAEGIAAGKLDQQIPVRTNDEVGRLARAFNEMSISLKNSMAGMAAERAKLVTVVSSLTDGVMMTDAEGKIVLANPAAERLFNFTAAKATGRTVIEAVQDHELDNLVKSCFKTGKEKIAQLDSATGKFLRVIVEPISAGGSTAALVLVQDLTELRNLQTVRRELVGNISHDLRTPLAGIKAMVETLQGSARDDKEAARDFLIRIDREVDRLTQMVSELTQLSRIETGKSELRMVPTDLNLLLEEVVAQMNPIAQKQAITIVTDLAATLPLVEVDRERIRQTIINLLHNAIKFNHTGGRVTISTRSDGDSITVTVSDTGSGISQEDLPHIFERFYKADKARSKGGSGLGLAIAKHTIQAHGGAIRAQSEEGQGSTFTFSLPLKSSVDTGDTKI